MGFAKLALILAGLILSGVACTNAGSETANSAQPASTPAAAMPATTPDEFASARINFKKNCETCHGETGVGGPKEVEGKRFKVPSLREGHALKHTDEKFVVQISEGEEEMPAFEDKLTPTEINDLVRFIRKEFQGK